MKPLTIYVNKLPSSLDQCGQVVKDELASTWVDIFAEQLQSRFAFCVAMNAQLSGPAQQRNRVTIEAVTRAADRLARSTGDAVGVEYTTGCARELGSKIAAWEDRIWAELKRMARVEDVATRNEAAVDVADEAVVVGA